MSAAVSVKGLRGLEVVRDVPDADVDIIAVHGLGADSTHCWRYQVEDPPGRKTGEIINWLEDDDMLPSEVTNARIMAFNYSSNWIRDADRITVWGLGTELMRVICMDRDGKDQKARERPIIFIGHSFGGIIIEQGIVAASFSASDYKLAPKCTVGIIALGTPHHGSGSAEWGKVVANFAGVLGLGSDKQLLEELNEGSQTLKTVVHNFVMWLGKYSAELHQFYETKLTNYGARFGTRWNEMVVPEARACLMGYPRIPLACDHFKLAKYTGPQDPSYKTVMMVIRKLAREAPEKALLRFKPREFKQDNSDIAAVNLECQKALFISWPKSDLEMIQRRLGNRTEKTCEWLLHRDEYSNWLGEKKPQVMRLVGSPGMGKSMILTFLIETLTEKLRATKDMVLAYHFCDNRNQSSNTATAVVRQILFQLFQQRPKFFHILQKAYDVAGAKLFSDFPKLWEILEDVLKAYHSSLEHAEGEVLLLIDALDECDEKSRKILLPKLQKLAASDLQVRLFFTCRPEDDIEAKYPKKDGIPTVSCIMDKDDIHHDLLLYMQDKIPKLCEEKNWGQDEETLISKVLMEKANGIFLWCSFVIDDIREVTRKSEIESCLNDLPKDLVAVYKRITNCFPIKNRLVAKTVLEIVAGGRRPLKVEELTTTYVLAEDCPSKDKWPKNTLPPDNHTKKHDDVFATCGRLLFKDKPTNTINLVHQSAKDYLLSEYLAGIDRNTDDKDEEAELDIDERLENTRKTSVRLNNVFLELIFRYYTLEDFDHLQYRMVFDAEWDIDWECSWWEMEPSPAFMGYCGREWENHARDAEDHHTDGMGRFINYITYKGKSPLAKGLKTKVVNPRTSVINSWLRKVAISGNTEFVGFLLDQGAQRDSANFRGWTAVQLAAKYGQSDVIDLLVERGAILNAVPPHIDGRTPVQAAAEEGLIDTLTQLIDLGADINFAPAKINGRTALQAAAEKGLGETVQFLVKQDGVDPNVEGAEVSGVTALLAAAGSGGEWQMGKNIHRTIKQRSRLPGSAEIDTQKIAEEDQQDRDQRLQEETHHEEVVRILVKNGAKIIPNQFNWTALHAAVERESDQMVDDMLGIFTTADCNIRGDHDGTPLHSAKAKANEELAKRLQDKGGTDECPYSKLDLDAMMKYIRAVLTRLMIRSNTERFFFIQSYIPVYHVIYSYCAEGADDQNDNPPVEEGGRRGELVYRDVDAWLKSYVKWNQKFINDTPANNDFMTVYLREWKLFKRGAYYVGRMLRYLTRHWVKHQREELKHKDIKDIADLFFHRWRTGMTSQVRAQIKKGMEQIDNDHKSKKHNDQRVKDAINEAMDVKVTGFYKDYVDIFQSAHEYFSTFSELAWDKDEDFEVELRNLSDEFEVESEVWIANEEKKTKTQLDAGQIKALKEAKKHEVLLGKDMDNCWKNPGAIDLYLNKLEPLFLEKYSGGKTEEIRRHVNALWDILRDDEEDARKRRENRQAAQANASTEINGDGILDNNGDVSMVGGPNGIKHTQMEAPAEQTAV